MFLFVDSQTLFCFFFKLPCMLKFCYGIIFYDAIMGSFYCSLVVSLSGDDHCIPGGFCTLPTGPFMFSHYNPLD